MEQEQQFTLHLGDCLEVMRGMPDNSVDSIVTDPPYELGFMGKAWDASGIANSVEMWREALRVLKPGGHLLSFSGSRTYHRMTCAIEDAGFEVRDQIMWVYGSGFPKSLDVSKAIDKAAGAEREVIGLNPHARPSDGVQFNAMGAKGHDPFITAPATDAARQWEGWGTALKPAHEPICVARKPLQGTVAANVLAHGTGALNIDGCRIPTDENLNGGAYAKDGSRSESHSLHGGSGMNQPGKTAGREFEQPAGRWPANLIHDGSDEVLAAFPDTSSEGHTPAARGVGGIGTSGHAGQDGIAERRFGTGRRAEDKNAARFFYCAKASKSDRNEGCDGLPVKAGGMVSNTSGKHMTRRDEGYAPAPVANHHPTVKPTALMAYLVRLVTPPGGTVLDPFMGSGSTGKAAMREGMRFVGIDMTPEYVEIARARIEHEAGQSAVAAPVAPPSEPVDDKPGTPIRTRRKPRPPRIQVEQGDLFEVAANG